jgi:hypothetical protein|tara:strand:- start:4692 stop:5024 length:333 start_codon:yes stop_codon:yes gene_type:complete
MSDFFESDIIQEELKEINDLQEKIYTTAMSFGTMSRDDKIEHIEMLQNLLEKQQVMYTRVSLSDDPKAVEMKENLQKSVLMMGFPPSTDIKTLFDSMNTTIETLKQHIDS